MGKGVTKAACGAQPKASTERVPGTAKRTLAQDGRRATVAFKGGELTEMVVASARAV